MRAVIETHEQEQGPALELHDGTATLAYENGGSTFVRVKLGHKDAAAVARYLRLAFPGLLELGSLFCECGQPATISKKATDGKAEDDCHWCESCLPPDALAGMDDGRVWLKPTKQAVTYLLRHTWGFTGPGEAEDQVHLHAYLLSRADPNSMTAQDVAEEIARRHRETQIAAG